MQNIIVHKQRFSLEELSVALKLHKAIESAYVSTFREGFIEITYKQDSGGE